MYLYICLNKLTKVTLQRTFYLLAVVYISKYTHISISMSLELQEPETVLDISYCYIKKPIKYCPP